MLALDASEADVDAALLQRLELFHRRHLVQGHVDLGVGFPVAADDVGQQAVQRGRDEADGQLAFQLAHTLRHRAQVVRLVEQRLRVRVKERAGLGQAQRPRAFFDQHDAEILFQLLDLPAQRRLGDVQPFGGACEVPLFRHGHEVT